QDRRLGRKHDRGGGRAPGRAVGGDRDFGGREGTGGAADALARPPRRLAKSSLIQLEDVKKGYGKGGEPGRALDGVSISIERGEFVAIMGSSGSGKSTLMNILGCLDRPSAGRYLLDGSDVSRLDKDHLAEIRNHLLGFVFQSFNLLPRT